MDHDGQHLDSGHGSYVDEDGHHHDGDDPGSYTDSNGRHTTLKRPGQYVQADHGHAGEAGEHTGSD